MAEPLSRNTKIFGVVSLLTDATSEAIIPLLPFFITVVLGGTEFDVGLMESLAIATTGIFGLVSTFYINRFGRKRKLILLGYSVSAVSKIFFAFATGVYQVIFIRFADRVGKGIRDIPRDTIMALSEKKSNLGRAYGFRQAMDSAGAIIGPLIASGILYFMMDSNLESAYRSTFLIAALPAILGTFLIFFVVDVRTKLSEGNDIMKKLRQLFSHKDYESVFIFGLMVFFSAFSVAFFILRAGEFTELYIVPLLYIAYNISYSLLSYPAGILADKFGPKMVTVAGIFVYIGSLVIFAFYPSVPTLALGFALLGIFKAVIETAPRKLLVEVVEEDLYPTSIGVYQSSVNLVGLPSNLVAGALWAFTIYGSPATFILGMAVSVFSLLMILRVESP